MKTLFCLAALLLLLAGCNPTRRIILKNNSGNPASFYWILKDRDSLWRSPFFLSNTDSSGITLQAEGPKNKAEMSFGSGSWTPAYLQEAVKDLRSMHLRWNKGAVHLNSTAEMMDFLLHRRRGLDKHRIVIVFE